MVHNRKDNILGSLMMPGVIGISNRISQVVSMLRLYFKFQTCGLAQHSSHQFKKLYFRTGAYQLLEFDVSKTFLNVWPAVQTQLFHIVADYT